MPSWKAVVVAGIKRLARESRIVITEKAKVELLALRASLPSILDLPELDEEDIREVLLDLKQAQLVQRLTSKRTGELLYVFHPEFYGETIYLKLAVRDDCVVISFHEQQ